MRGIREKKGAGRDRSREGDVSDVILASHGGRAHSSRIWLSRRRGTPRGAFLDRQARGMLLWHERARGGGCVLVAVNL